VTAFVDCDANTGRVAELKVRIAVQSIAELEVCAPRIVRRSGPPVVDATDRRVTLKVANTSFVWGAAHDTLSRHCLQTYEKVRSLCLK
jgi:hypothetical protein